MKFELTKSNEKFEVTTQYAHMPGFPVLIDPKGEHVPLRIRGLATFSWRECQYVSPTRTGEYVGIMLGAPIQTNGWWIGIRIDNKIEWVPIDQLLFVEIHNQET